MTREPIAIIGLGCRFPGAADPRMLWAVLAGGVDAITPVPAERWSLAEFYDSDAAAEGKMTTRWGGFIDQVDRFDPQFFKIAPREVASMDPQQRLLLEVTWEALEDAGQRPELLAGSATGVFVGISSYDYCTLLSEDKRNIDGHFGTGNTNCIAANRISYVLDFRGPSLAIDTACSSSLVSVHLACRSLLAGDASLAVAGGVQLVLSPWATIAYSKSGFMSPDGRCKAFDASANGYVRSDGAGMVVLKLLSRALADGDRIYAVIRGSAVNQDGRSNGLTAPNPAAQEAVLRDAYRDAAIAPSSVHYIEAHGSGTPLGDPIEMKSLAAVVGQGRPPGDTCAVGSIKSNIGHPEAAAGIAGLMKLALSIHHRQIPPSLHFHTPNPYIPFDRIPLRVPTALEPWPDGGALPTGGVNSFGFGGTNVHMVLQGHQPDGPRAPGEERPQHVLVLHARSERALAELAASYGRFLREQPVDVADVCYSANTGRSRFPHRLAAVTRSAAELAGQLEAFAEGREAPNLQAAEVTSRVPPRLAFLFTGLGAQHPGMARQLYQTQPSFRATLDRCDAVLRGHLDRPLLSLLYPSAADAAAAAAAAPDDRIRSRRSFLKPAPPSLLDRTIYAQPALFAVEVALAELWRSWGVEPAMVIGHSVGELAAACVAGVFSLDDGLRFVAERARLIEALPCDGAMASVLAPAAQVAERLAEYGDRVVVAAINGPENVTISGEREAVRAVVQELDAAGWPVQPVRVTRAFHSPLIEPALDELERVAREIPMSAPRIPLVSNVSGAAFPAGEVPGPSYWRAHTRRPVQFQAGIEALRAHGCDAMLEIGPAPVLTYLGAQCVPPEAPVLWLPSLVEHQDDWMVLATTLSALVLKGREIDWRGFDRDHPRRRLSLPHYPYERKRYWFAHAVVPTSPPSPPTSTVEEPMLTPDIESAVSSARHQALVSELHAMVAAALRAELSDVGVGMTFLDMGADSFSLLELVDQIRDKYGQELDIRDLFEVVPTIRALAEHIADRLPAPAEAPAPAAPTPAQVAPLALVGAPTPATPSRHAAIVASLRETLGQILHARPDEISPQVAFLELGADSSMLIQMLRQVEIHHEQRVTIRQLFEELPNLDELAAYLARGRSKAQARAAQHAPARAANGNAAHATPYLPRPMPAPVDDGAAARQQRHLRVFVERFSRRTARSKHLAQEHRPELADSRATAGFRLPIKEISYPIMGARYRGSRIWDVDGNEYVDIAMGFGVHLFGHDAPFIRQAILDQMEKGFGIGPQPELAGELARLFVKLTGAERVVFCQSGSEAVMTALRLARAATRREKVVMFKGSFHGHFDGVLAQSSGDGTGGVPVTIGVSAGAVRDVVVLDYGEPSALEYLRARGHELAAVLVEPVQSRWPDLQPRAFLHEVRALTAATGAALIFDEIITGFRIHPGGAQAHFGVAADLATYGKIPGGGLPLAAVAGSSRFMDGIDGGQWRFGDDSYPQVERTFFAGTFNKPPLSLATAVAVLRELDRQGPELQEQLTRRTAHLVEQINRAFQVGEVPAHVAQFGSLFRFILRGNLELFYYHLVERGVYVWEGRSCFLSTAHTDADIEYVLAAVRDSVDELREAGFFSGPSGRPTPSDEPPQPGKPAAAPRDTARISTDAPTPRAEGPRPAFWERRRRPVGQGTTPRAAARWHRAREALEFSLYYFGKYEAAYRSDKYDLLFDGARFADAHDFTAIWLPERHFHPFGGFSPSPAMLCAALARETRRLHLRAGSVVVPLHHPVRIAEEWAVVDNLAPGRVGISFASGWHSDDFVFAPDAYGRHRELMLEGIQSIRALWRGEKIRARAGGGAEIDVGCYPRPSTPALPTWITSVNNPDTYVQAAKLGAGVLTNLLGQSLDDLAANIELYRQAIAQAGRDPRSGHVTVLLHTYVGDDLERTRDEARGPFCDYLDAHIALSKNLLKRQGSSIDIDRLAPEDRRYLLGMAYERYVKDSALIGSDEACAPILDGLREAGVDEIACFVDFGMDAHRVRAGFPRLQALRDGYRGGAGRAAPAATPLSAPTRGPTPPASPAAAPEAPAERTFPLTLAQREALTLTELAVTDTAIGNSICLELHGALRLECLRRALDQVVLRHETLRSRFTPERDAMRVAAHADPIAIEVADLVGAPDGAAAARGWLLAEGRRDFDLERGPVLRGSVAALGQDRHLFLLSAHQTLCDGWSLGILCEEVGKLYSAACDGRPRPLLEPLPFRDYVALLNAQLASPDMERHEQYWLALLSGDIPQLELPTDRQRPPIKTYRASRISHRIDAALGRELYRRASEQRVTPFMLTLAAYLLLLHRLSGQDRVIVGIPVAGQIVEMKRALVGHCANVLPIVSSIAGCERVADFLARVQTAVLDAFEHRDYPYHRLVSRLPIPRDPSRIPLISVMFNLDRSTPVEMSGLRVDYWQDQPIEFALTDTSISMTVVDGEMVVDWNYNRDLFDRDTVARWQTYYEAVLRAFAADPRVSLADLVIAPAAERHRVLHEWNDTAVRFAEDGACLHELFERQVERTPAAPAAAFGAARWTFAELSAHANRLAHHFRSLGVGPEGRVAICLPRSLDMLCAVLATWKAGGAYVPLDPATPPARLREILDGARPRLLVTESRLAGAMSAGVRDVVCVDALEAVLAAEDDTAPDAAASSSSAAYVLYTSGSTGQPRGVVVEHRSVVNLLGALRRAVYASHRGPLRVAVNGPLSFDTSVKQIIQLLDGHALDLIPDELRVDPEAMCGYVRERAIEVLDCTPTQLRPLVAAGLLRERGALRCVLVGGEAIDQALWDELAASPIDCINVYGPTECTVDATACRIEPGQAPSLGRPLSNVRTYVLDRHRQPVPIGVPGELYIAGAGVARGYLGDPDATAERFGHEPFGDHAGARMYRTGDRARLCADGRLEFLGRLDDQVKLRGFRVDLAGVEAVLARQPGVRACAVTLVGTGRADRDPRLVAYVVPAEACRSELPRTLRASLPVYMVPAVFVGLPALPCTPNGKLDRDALPPPSSAAITAAEEYVAPRTPSEEMLAAIWSEVLYGDAAEHPPVGVTANFFHLGGSSLLAMHLLDLVERRMGQRFRIQDLLEEPTIEHMVEVIQRFNSWNGLIQRYDGDTGTSKDREHQVRRKVLVALRAHGERPPLFFVPPLSGLYPSSLVTGVLELAKHLDPDLPFYALQLPAVAPELAELDRAAIERWRYDARRFESLVDDSLALVEGARPDGPISLASWCTGYRIGLELARRLRDRGRAVHGLVLLDPSFNMSMETAEQGASAVTENDPQPADRSWSAVTERDPQLADLSWYVAKEMGGRAGWDPLALYDELRAIPEAGRWEHACARLVAGGYVPGHTTASALRHVYDLRATTRLVVRRLFEALPPASYDGPVTMVFAESDRDPATDPRLATAMQQVRRGLRGDLRLKQVPGDHFSIFQEPNVHALVAEMNLALAGAVPG